MSTRNGCPDDGDGHQYIRPSDAEEFSMSLTALHKGQETINLTLVKLATVVEGLVIVQEKQSDFGEKMAVSITKADALTIKVLALENAQEKERDARVSTMRWVWGIVIGLTVSLAGMVLPHLHWAAH